MPPFEIRRASLPVALLLLLLCVAPASAQVTAEQRQELTQIKRDLGKVSSLIRKKELDEAASLLDSAEDQLESIADSAGLEPDDRKLLGVMPTIERYRKALENVRGKAGGGGGVSFSKDVAPIIAENCLGCHSGNRARGNLRLDTFAGWKRGGQNGLLLRPRNSNASLIMARLVAPNPQQRMPRGRAALSPEQIRTIATWITQGARYDADDDGVPLGDLASRAEMEDDPTVVIPKPKGNETVSFTRDIAPFIANLCGNCHSAQRRSGGLSLANFYDMMKGGDSGRVILPGNREGSRLFRLTGGLEGPRMPQGQARLTRKNYEDLVKWFDEGNAFDGEDPRTPLREYVKTEAEMEAEKFASMSDEEFNKYRFDHSESQWKRALPNDSYGFVQSDDLLVIGNVSQQRLQQVDEWGQSAVDELRKMFGSGSDQPWKGRLTVFVFKDRFGYDEFNLVIEERRADPKMVGHSRVTTGFQEAYVALLDVGDEADAENPGLRVNLIDHMTGAFVRRSGNAPPGWLLRGLGLAIAAKMQPANPYFRNLDKLASQAVGSLRDPEDVFAEGTFSPSTTGPVGYTLVEYMMSAGGTGRFVRFVNSIVQGQSTAASARAVYQSSLDALARSYLKSLAKR
ncbi:MAG: c-type cytochrome domain-containing protein [Maioricimonas sp. JB045]|uniref:c-type cytochrome domain-containing protein n=1 Tax=Maioricimonas sp. JC845 TaxID=3232138 RepID=UPI003459C470